MNAAKEFNQYTAYLSEGLGHADRHAGLSGYCTDLMLPLSRKSVEPMAARVDPLHASARHQALHHFVVKSEWSDTAIIVAAAQSLSGAWHTTGEAAPRARQCADDSQGTGHSAGATSLAHRHRREGSNHELSGRFSALRMRPAHWDYLGTEMRPEEWLLIEWPEGEAEPAKYFLTTARGGDTGTKGVRHQNALAHRAGLPGLEAGLRAGSL
jgi:SRSO17 transposase